MNNPCKTQRDCPEVIDPIKISKKYRKNNQQSNFEDHQIKEIITSREDIKYDNNYNNKEVDRNDTNNTNNKQSTYDICWNRFGSIADPRFSATANTNQIAKSTRPTDLPWKPSNLQYHNLCQKKEVVLEDILKTLGLNLSFSILLPSKKYKLFIDFL